MIFQIETERLILRDVCEDDVPVLVGLFGEPESKRQILSFQSDEAHNRADLENAMAWAKVEDRLRYTLAVVRKEDSAVIGDCSLWNVVRESYATGIGWHYGAAYQGNGYATEAARAMIDFGFREKKVAAIFADCFEDNPKSIRVIRKLGMMPQWDFGIFNLLRGFSYREFRSTVRHSITREYWLERHEA